MPRPSHSRGRFNRAPRIRKNHQIRAREVRLIGPDGKQIGVVPIQDAQKRANAYGLDLVEISGNSNPPICRILDYGKYAYEQSKRQKDKKSSTSRLKEMKLRVKIDQHDYMTKIRRAEVFLYKGSKLKISLMFRGRENEHKDLGLDVVRRACQDLAHVATIDAEPRLNGRFVNAVLAPLPQNKRSLKYTAKDEDLDAHDDDDDFDDEHDSAEDEGAESEESFGSKIDLPNS